ncbi:MAG: hypothetical protein KA801_11260 [Syntrophorhabdaceae bacterium]|nr:hypothetical protein [Syntrophorhabdaceae bacterium]
MIPDSYSVMINKLCDKTLEGKINWKTTADDNRYLIDFRDFSLTTTLYIPAIGDKNVAIHLWDKNGRVIDYFHVLNGEPDFDKLELMFDGARRKAKRIDEAISFITQELDTAETVGDTSEDDPM